MPFSKKSSLHSWRIQLDTVAHCRLVSTDSNITAVKKCVIRIDSCFFELKKTHQLCSFKVPPACSASQSSLHVSQHFHYPKLLRPYSTPYIKIHVCIAGCLQQRVIITRWLKLISCPLFYCMMTPAVFSTIIPMEPRLTIKFLLQYLPAAHYPKLRH